MQKGFVSLATVLMLATGCGQLGGVCEKDCEEQGASGGSGGGTGVVEPGVRPADAKAIPAGQRVVGYLPTWYGKLQTYATDAVLSRLTHVAIAFASVDAQGVRFSDPNDIKAFVARAHAFNVKVLVSLGGANGSAAVAAQIVPANLAAFVAHTMTCVQDYQLDGVDVDIEGNSVNADYEPLVAALSAELKPRGLILSSAVGNWFEQRITPTALGLFDFVQVMAYDACGSWTDPCPHSSLELATSQIAFWVQSRGVPADKMVLGVPFYARYWGPTDADIVPYGEMLQRFPDAWQTDWIDDGTNQYSYNGKATIAAKVGLGAQHGGLMIWDLPSDQLATDRQLGEHSLLRVVNDSY
jgi:chitinase